MAVFYLCLSLVLPIVWLHFVSPNVIAGLAKMHQDFKIAANVFVVVHSSVVNGATAMLVITVPFLISTFAYTSGLLDQMTRESAMAQIEIGIQTHLIKILSRRTSAGTAASPSLEEVMDELMRNFTAEPESVVPLLARDQFPTNRRDTRIAAATKYIETLRQSLGTLEPEPGKGAGSEGLRVSERRALGVNVTFVDIADA
ncbi:hypothetical protein B0T16DRAFT_393683 [Cercophora newfieldiana]|uniref:Uncharacterized protein n=1 Tax=Cercophora newfieldiana TaxID=92897 RepID=A0AA39XXW8_9PEZI|nr:hypothetical protein B0T16DRAFT_393683 [Cercophora newfieldiana]